MWYAALPRLPVPAYAYHQMLWTYVPEIHRQPGAARPFVYRIRRDRIDYLSRYRPACEARAISPEIVTGRVYQFELRCSPVRGTQRNGVRTRRDPYRTNAERRDWLARRLDGAARLHFATVFDRPPLSLRAPGQRAIVWPECDITGTLEVIDRTAMIERMSAGIGGRGCWGHGLLYLPEVMG